MKAAPAENHSPLPPGPAGGWLLPGLLLALWAYTVYRLGTLWQSNEHYRFGWLVPFFCLALLTERWPSRPAPQPAAPGKTALLLLALSGLGLFLGALALEVIPAWRFAGWIFAGSTVGATLLGLRFLGGGGWARHFAFPVLFFLVAVPWPTRLEAPLIAWLSDVNAALSTELSGLLGSPCIRHGTTIETGAGVVGVEDACSGIRSLQSTVMVALFLGELFAYSLFRRAALLLGGMAMALSCNIVRTTYLVRTADLHGLAAVKDRHDQAGFAILGITLAGLLVLAWAIRPRAALASGPAPPPAPPVPPTTRPHAPPLAVAALAALVAWVLSFELGIELWFGSGEKQAARVVPWTCQLPAGEAGFAENPVPDATRGMLKYDEGRQAEWRDAANRRWQLYYLRWLPTRNRYRAVETSEQARGHAPDICMSNAGMILQTNLGTSILDLHGIPFRATTERFLDGQRNFHILAAYYEPRSTAFEARPAGQPSTGLGWRLAAQSVRNHERGRYEKRVIKIGVWDMPTDAEARQALEARLRNLISVTAQN